MTRKEDDPWADRRESLRRHLDRARRYQRRIETGDVRNASEIARREGITRVRVCQLMRLLHLAPEILEDVENPEGVGSVPTEKALRRVAALPSSMQQVRRYRELVEQEKARGGKTLKKGTRLPRRGIQHLLARARRYQTMLDDREVQSLEELGRQEGLTGGRIAQILNLLHLAPVILSVIDVPNEELPPQISEGNLRKIARLQDQDEQIWEFRKLAGF